MNAWEWYLEYRWIEIPKIFEYELYGDAHLAEQWMELDQVPAEINEKIKWLCHEVIPVKTKTVEIIDEILEHSIISSIQVQLVSVLIVHPSAVVFVNFEICVSSAVYTCFNRIRESPIFKTLIKEYRTIWMAARRIQYCWRRCISNPSYFMCKRRLHREFEEITWNQIVYKQVCV
jgi:hypothetical protein